MTNSDWVRLLQLNNKLNQSQIIGLEVIAPNSNWGMKFMDIGYFDNIENYWNDNTWKYGNIYGF